MYLLLLRLPSRTHSGQDGDASRPINSTSLAIKNQTTKTKQKKKKELNTTKQKHSKLVRHTTEATEHKREKRKVKGAAHQTGHSVRKVDEKER